MNILVRTADGRYIVRPDTTWERDNEPFYPPEFVNEISWSPVLYVRISKPGRSVGARFAERYYDSIAYGTLLYPENLIDGTETSYASASCLDHTSFLPLPAVALDEAAESGFGFELTVEQCCRDSRHLFSCGAPDRSLIARAIEEATRYIYIRSGDLLAIELQAREILCRRDDGSVSVKGLLGGRRFLDFDIIF